MHEQAIAPDGREPQKQGAVDPTAFHSHADEIRALQDGTHPALNAATETDDREHSVAVDAHDLHPERRVQHG